MSSTEAKSAQRRNGSAAKAARRAHVQPDPGPLPEPVRELVDERPWLMVGAAAGLGLVLGSATRSSRLTGSVTQMLAATASGVATRVAMTALVNWIEPQLAAKR